jgi:hypothetical protein
MGKRRTELVERRVIASDRRAAATVAQGRYGAPYSLQLQEGGGG